MTITSELLKEIFDYDPQAGVITHKLKPRSMFDSERGWKIANSRCMGKIATVGNSSGYLSVMVGQTPVVATKVALACMGVDLDNVSMVRFADGNKSNIKWSNLIIKKKWSKISSSNSHVDILIDDAGGGRVSVSMSGRIVVNDELDALEIKRRIEAVLRGEL